ncbi:hypothetical protein J4732_15610, partial [Serratia marcescens]|nr:hypothetical protein [Serratia marcescens]
AIITFMRDFHRFVNITAILPGLNCPRVASRKQFAMSVLWYLECAAEARAALSRVSWASSDLSRN